MNKKYLIDADKCFVAGFTKASFEPSDTKEVEVLDEKTTTILSREFIHSNQYVNFSDYLKANNLLIVKIIGQ